MNNQDFATEAARLLTELADGHAIISQCEKKRILSEVFGVLDYPADTISALSETRIENPGKRMPWQALVAFQERIIASHAGFDQALKHAASTLVRELSQLYWGSKGRENRILAILSKTLDDTTRETLQSELLVAYEKH